MSEGQYSRICGRRRSMISSDVEFTGFQRLVAGATGLALLPGRLCRLFHVFQLFHSFQVFQLFQVFQKRTLSLKNETKRPDMGNYDPFFDENAKKADKCSTPFHPRCSPVEHFRRETHRREWVNFIGMEIMRFADGIKFGTGSPSRSETAVWERLEKM